MSCNLSLSLKKSMNSLFSTFFKSKLKSPFRIMGVVPNSCSRNYPNITTALGVYEYMRKFERKNNFIMTIKLYSGIQKPKYLSLSFIVLSIAQISSYSSFAILLHSNFNRFLLNFINMCGVETNIQSRFHIKRPYKFDKTIADNKKYL